MTPGEHWLATLWPLVRAHLPAPPARVVDIGCGPHGGFVPFLHSNGYDAAGSIRRRRISPTTTASSSSTSNFPSESMH
jgi:hypothetical protein